VKLSYCAGKEWKANGSSAYPICCLHAGENSPSLLVKCRIITHWDKNKPTARTETNGKPYSKTKDSVSISEQAVFISL